MSLDQTDEEEIDAFVWAGTAIEASDSFEDDLEHLRKQYIAEQATTAKLRKQLDELAKAKGEHEKELITKFAELLNSKKLKIRDQQRLLAGAKIDPQARKSWMHVSGQRTRELIILSSASHKCRRQNQLKYNVQETDC